MSRDLLCWILGGALAASLGWNLRTLEPLRRDPLPACATEGAGGGTTCATDCPLDPRALGLSEEQAAELTRLCAGSCADSERLEARAREKGDELRVLLAAEALDEARIRALVEEASSLHRAALESCVAAVIDVRRVLRPEQVAELLRACSPMGGNPTCPE